MTTLPIESLPLWVSSAESDIIQLDVAMLCADCDAITSAPHGACVRCGSLALLPLARILNRSEEVAA